MNEQFNLNKLSMNEQFNLNKLSIHEQFNLKSIYKQPYYNLSFYNLRTKMAIELHNADDVYYDPVHIDFLLPTIYNIQPFKSDIHLYYSYTNDSITYFNGIIARSLAYFMIFYPNCNLDKYINIQNLIKWNKEYPITDYEIHKNMLSKKTQFNTNPFIDNPELLNEVFS
jgi:hypothetical protein